MNRLIDKFLKEHKVSDARRLSLTTILEVYYDLIIFTNKWFFSTNYNE